jgi:hypothetical protein
MYARGTAFKINRIQKSLDISIQLHQHVIYLLFDHAIYVSIYGTGWTTLLFARSKRHKSMFMVRVVLHISVRNV